MKIFISLFVFIFAFTFGSAVYSKDNPANKDILNKKIDLPKPSASRISLDDAIKKRRTTRKFDEKKKVTLQELSDILYSMQGLTDSKKRTVPSAMGYYPLELYIIANNVEGLEDGMYKMNIPDFKLIMFRKGDFKKEIAEACMNQSGAKKAQLRIVVTSVLKRLKADSVDTAKLWGMFEAGAASQNSYLMATALGMNNIPMGGMNPEMVAKVIGVNYKEEIPLIVNCFGR